jgi:hypothetical protein
MSRFSAWSSGAVSSGWVYVSRVLRLRSTSTSTFRASSLFDDFSEADKVSFVAFLRVGGDGALRFEESPSAGLYCFAASLRYAANRPLNPKSFSFDLRTWFGVGDGTSGSLLCVATEFSEDSAGGLTLSSWISETQIVVGHLRCKKAMMRQFAHFGQSVGILWTVVVSKVSQKSEVTCK